MKIINAIGIGLAFGFVFTTFFMTLFTGFNETTIQTIAWLIASACYGGSALVFEIKNLKLPYISLIHYAICATITGIMTFLFYKELFLTVFVSFTIVYLICYTVMFFVESYQTKEINKKLKKGK